MDEAVLRVLERAVATVPGALCRYDLQRGRLMPLGDGMAMLLGYETEYIAALEPAQLLRLIHPEDRSRLFVLMRRLALPADEDIGGGALRARHADGRWRRLRFKASALQQAEDGSGRCRMVLAWFAPDLGGAPEPSTAPGEASGSGTYTLLTELLDHLPENVTLSLGPPAFQVIAASRRTVQLFGRSIRRLADLVPDEGACGLYVPGPERLASVIELIPAFRAVRVGEAVRGEEWIVRRADGTSVTVEVDAVPVREGRRIVGAVSVWREVADRQRVEQALREKSEQLGFVVRSTRACLWCYEFATQAFVWSEECRRLLMWPDDCEPGYERFLDSVRPEDRERVAQAFAHVFREGCALEAEFRVSLPDGEERWVGAFADVFCDEMSQPLRIFGVMLDLTARRRAQLALVESERRFLELSRSVQLQRSGSGAAK